MKQNQSKRVLSQEEKDQLQKEMDDQILRLMKKTGMSKLAVLEMMAEYHEQKKIVKNPVTKGE